MLQIWDMSDDETVWKSAESGGRWPTSDCNAAFYLLFDKLMIAYPFWLLQMQTNIIHILT